MSLNGLDDPAVIDAYQTALAEAGAWLLLKYASRDEVTLLGRGTGGVPDVRATVEGYEEKSPLYGFLQYRRRKIVLKYVPDGMSRLVQARTTVQFQSILDKFSPQDTTFEFKAPIDLTESALSSACLLHAVSGSITSSSSSLRRRRLMEIAEDAEEGPPPSGSYAESSKSPDDSNDKRLSQISDVTAVPPGKKEDESPITSNITDNDADAKTDTASIHSVSRKRFLDQFHRDSFDRRSSTQSARPTLQELNYAAPYRQKVKMEHRPSVDINNRPRTAGSMSRGQDYRPVAALPAGVRSRKPAGSSHRPKSTPDVPPVPTLASLRNAPPVPLLIPPPTLTIAKPKFSPGAKSMNALPSSGMSPEKQRLMKALELRKKQMEKKTQSLQKKPEQKDATVSKPTTVVESLEDKENIGHSPVKRSPSVATLKEAETETKSPAVATSEIVDDKKPLSADIAKADSAVEMVTLASKDTESQPEELTNGTTLDEEEHPSDGIEDVNNNHVENKDPQQAEPEVEISTQDDNVNNDVTDATNVDEFTQLSAKETVIQPTTEVETSPQENVKNDATDATNIDVPTELSREDTTELETSPQDNAVENVSDATNTDESAQLPKEETATQTQRTADLENTMNSLIGSPRAEETELQGEETEATGEAEETQPETEEPDETETPQASNENSHVESDTPAVPAVELQVPEREEPAFVEEDDAEGGDEEEEEEEVRAEDIPLPPESGEDLAQVSTAAGRQAALEPAGSTTQIIQQRQQPLPLPAEPAAENEPSEKHKRIALLEPIQVPTPDFSDDENFLSDDSLMEELTSATVQEAQPVSVGKGPLSLDGEPRTPLEAWQTRAVSNPGRRPSEFSSLPSDTRSISATYVDGNSQSIKPVPVLVAKKVNVSSGISKRIKALEMFSNNRDSVSGPPGNAPATPTGNVASPTASAFEKFRKRASVSLNGNLPSATPSARSSFISTSETSHLNRSDSRSVSRMNSVSVTARIVRDPSTPPTESVSNPIDTNVLGLQRSPLTVQHDSSERPTPERIPSNGVAELRSSAFSSRRNSTDTAIPPRSDSRASSRSRFDERSKDLGTSPEDKKDSRTSRLMRRMSSLRSSSRKNLMSPPGIDKQTLPSPQREVVPAQRAPSQAIDVGEVNVQFPDTLLWKRRYLRIDDQGYLVLTPGNMDTGARNIVKRYHLSEFKTPCLPDEDRQELPNSILLDFCNGSTLQCACESRKGQATVLQTLVDAHNTYYH